MSPDATREALIHAALRVVSARQWNDIRPEDPHGADSIQYAEEALDDFAKQLTVALINREIEEAEQKRTLQDLIDYLSIT